MTEQELKKQIAKNLIHYRKLANITQAELAEELNYSDKSISKWERGEGVPDIFVLHQIASLYRISVNDLISANQRKRLPLEHKSKFLLTLLSVGVVWLVAVTCFVIIQLAAPSLQKVWLAYVYAIPVSAIVTLVFGSVWNRKILSAVSTSILIWSIALSVYLSFLPTYDLWLIFLIAVPMQALTIIWFFFRHILQNIGKHKVEMEKIKKEKENSEQNDSSKDTAKPN